jgi:dynein heavy chain
MRRNVFVTPKSYLSFIEMYKIVYEKKFIILNDLEKNVTIGLKKMYEAEKQVEEMKIELG